MNLIVVGADEKVELIQELWGDDVGVADVDLVLDKHSIRAGFGKNGTAAHSLILNSSVLIGVTHPKLISIAVVVKDTP